ncbi:P-loop containing nucleoside triphosphate hydrolase protein, partial [Obba rivulosa]
MSGAMKDHEPRDDPEKSTPVCTRGYQQEMLEESFRRNLIIALDTGSGKTHIAVLRMKLECERETQKVSWFLAPTVALVQQQREVIASAIPVSVGIISGACEPNQWKDANLWRKILQTHRIMVTTPQVLLDALHHAYVDLGRDISLLVFDEAHHAVKVHPYNAIMSNFYFDLPQRNASHGSQDRVRPMILGLTASPIYGGNVDKSFAVLEKNLDSVIRSTRLNRDELSQHVHRSVFKHLLYAAPVYDWENVPSRNYQALRAVVDSLYIEDDPYVKGLRQQLAKLPLGDERTRIDQKLSKTIGKQDTFAHRGLKDFARAAQEICLDLGVWAADWYVVEVIKRARFAADPYNNIMSTWQEKEKRYLLSIISRIQAVPPSDAPDDIRLGSSAKVQRLVDCLLAEHANAEAQDETYSGLVFVTRRDTVIALAELLSRFPEMAQRFNIGSLLGSSNSFQRHTFLDITRTIPKDSHLETLRDFKIGDKNLIISTSVAEEGIDIQACGSVIRFDPPSNMVSWAQSRGRARRKKSTFILMFEDGSVQQKLVQQWEEIEARMTALYNDVSRDAAPAPECDDDDGDDPQEYVVESTGAVLTLHSATSHLNHFCAVLPNARHGQGDFLPVYDLDPPEFPEGWHVTRDALPIYEGPWGAKVTLPRAVPKDLRIFSTQRIYKSKRSAQRHAAFRAYVTLHKAGLLSDNLLPLTSVVEQDRDGEVKKLLEEVEKRASTAKVSLQVDPWAAPENTNTWWINELSAVDLPTLTFLTRMPITPLSDIDPPPLYLPGPKHVHFRVRPLGVTTDDEDYISKARAYTLRLFSTLYGQRMNPDDTEFTYLFLPAAERSHDAVWETRRQWMEDRVSRDHTVRFESAERANVEILAKDFSYPDDLALIRPNERFGKAVRFVMWRYEPMSVEEEEIFR